MNAPMAVPTKEAAPTREDFVDALRRALVNIAEREKAERHESTAGRETRQT